MNERPPEPRGHEPMTEDQILAAHIGEKRPHNDTIHLADYDAAWPALFARHADRIGSALGDRALMIEHVGSTSVPGLAAKPTIDILLVVANSADEDSFVQPMDTAGYELRVREPEWHEHRVFADGERTAQVHVLSEGNPEIERYLLFRDRLRTNGRTASSMSERNASWPRGNGSTSRTTRTLRVTSSRRSSLGPGRPSGGPAPPSTREPNDVSLGVHTAHGLVYDERREAFPYESLTEVAPRHRAGPSEWRLR